MRRVPLLEDLGHSVIEAHSGKEALAIFGAGLKPDLVITDHAMPGMTGMDLALSLRKDHPELPILLATGYAEFQGDASIDAKTGETLHARATIIGNREASSDVGKLRVPSV